MIGALGSFVRPASVAPALEPDGGPVHRRPGNNEIYVESTLGVEINRQQVHTAGVRPYEIVNGGGGYLYFTEFTVAFAPALARSG